MAREEEPKQSPRDPKNKPRGSDPVQVGNGSTGDSLFSPRFKSVAAMAGWDEESLLIASLVVDDTPEREFKHKKRSDSHFKTPPTNSSRRKRRAQRRSPISIPIAVLDLDDEETTKEESGKEKAEPQTVVNKEKKSGGDKMTESSSVCSSSSNLPCLDKLRDELSCAICLDICFEPTTTPCGHSFCKKCLRSAADKCGKRCPKCRQLISNGRSCTVNTVLWNTIQLLFPQEVEVRKAAGALNNREAELQIPEKKFNGDSRNQSRQAAGISSRDMTGRRRRLLLSQDVDESDDVALPLAIRLQIREAERHQNPEQGAYSNTRLRVLRASSRDMNVRSSTRSRRVPSQDEDAALALRLQREEFMEAFRVTDDQSSSSLSSARANLRAMTSRAINHRVTTRHM